MENVHVVIPARYSSSRLPGKPLLKLNDKPMIWHVYQRAIESGYKSIMVATDHIDIAKEVKRFGGRAVLTSTDHESGTDRLAEAATIMGFGKDDIVVNLQGDEPLIPYELIKQVVELLVKDEEAGLATLCCEIRDQTSVFNPNVVKVVKASNGRALYFSRAPIPWNREDFGVDSAFSISSNSYFRHIGLYAYRVRSLKRIASLPMSNLEKHESLEQLRALESGMAIQVGVVDTAPPHGVDTLEDFTAIKKFFEEC
ncbi:3-deoxy-manno-octulosonate cytidylyltransferase [Agarivorans sp. B2Z047]|uniref:3-deoxy-manno-octulosonate cytidylyltransferase n=1 Tax=Agarivorans sp. B2Z047 TaxID=2652721 RepID=UPI00128DE642|nr:3-deoxy-manno-octulosonate cytidylyltransferase [Agarivorans sp. B2Z047]MPW28736.1 3-deoxy-manno-octulosonate cytidylyltransferase [Agarivorans sp. B2Z047]UQN41297.1 3-deoxy-manno-octulosonate cytidylyltransferase [Agarivorans sp. B2Z047]